MNEQLDDFLKFCKEELNLNVYVDESAEPDTLEDIFGDMFFEENNDEE